MMLALGATSRMAQTAAASWRRLFMVLEPDVFEYQPLIGLGHASNAVPGRIVWMEATIV